MAVSSAAKSKVYICTSTTIPTTLSAFKALTWVEVGEVMEVGEFGDESDVIEFTALGDARVRKFKGPRDAGTLEITCGRSPNDAGQIAVRAALNDDFDRPFKIVLNDKLTTGGTPTGFYFGGSVLGMKTKVGNVKDIVEDTITIGVNTAILEDVAT
ncbi:hypothetical protein [Alsobacter sp. R-9]